MKKKLSFLQALRTLLFYFLLSCSVLIWGIVCLAVFLFIPYAWLMKGFIQPWCRFVVGLASVVVGVKYNITGLENLPKNACVIVSKHQSTWETIFYTGLIYPISNVLKRELQFIPFFGWMLALSRQVAINRGTPKEAFKQLLDKGSKLLKAGHYIVIFPEGTRTLPGQNGRFTRGGITLAATAGVEAIPVAHNAGEFWPKKGWAKFPGVINVVFGEPIKPQGSDAESIAQANKAAEAWIVTTMQKITSPIFLEKGNETTLSES
ncbi:1-acyl-sn-glycerol-3-phosphate acyltransferase [Gammaproteobacteria bacterium ESL0073]|nr:1-acyl-sn-glycerol-3-phosphate acyltransferase [Gammaproteobacteria bacterium ESL0073]